MLQIDGLSKSYHGRTVLAPVRFCLPAGFCLGITGGNGAGKSTLLRLVAQIEQPDCGTIRYQGKEILGDRSFLRKHIGYVPQHNDLMEDLTVAAQLKLWQSACGLSGAFPQEIMDLMNITPMLKTRIKNLSGGMQRRVSIAMALMTNPEILILDESTNALDAGYRQVFMEYLEKYLHRGGRILFCSHDPAELNRLCGSFLHLENGHVQHKNT